MGPVRHQQLIRLLACLVTLDLVAGVAAIYVRGDRASATDRRLPTSLAAEPSTASGILAAGRFSQRRGGTGRSRPTAPDSAETAAAAPTSAAPSSTTTAPPPPGTADRSTERRPRTSTTRPRATTSTTAAVTTSTRPATTSSTTAPTSPPPSAGPGSPAASLPAEQAASSPGPGSADADPAWVVIDDPAGDTVVDGTRQPRGDSRADIVHTRVTNQANGIVLSAQAAQRIDPAEDPNWATDSTFLSWELDTDGDARPDFEVQFFLDGGTPVAGVSRVGDPDNNAACPAEAGYVQDSYAVGLDPACLGSPTAFSYRVTIYYDTDPKNENAAVITDTTPDGGLSRPIARSGG